MGTKEKLIDRFCKLPKDFTYEETLKLHPGSIMKAWMMKAIYQHLESNGLINEED